MSHWVWKSVHSPGGEYCPTVYIPRNVAADMEAGPQPRRPLLALYQCVLYIPRNVAADMEAGPQPRRPILAL